MPSRRRLLAAGCGLLTALAGCGSDARTRTATGSPTATEATATQNPTATETDATVRAGIDRGAYLFSAETIPRAALGPRDHETTTLGELNDATRTAVETAITDGRYTTADPPSALLDGIETIPLVAYQGTYYVVSHTFPTHTLTLDQSVPEENAPENRTVSRDSDAVQDSETVREAITTISPRPSSNGDPYVTTRLSDALRSFLDEYDYLRYPGGVGEFVLTSTERAPPHSVTATEATDEQLYDRQVYSLDAFTETSRALIRGTLNNQRKTPLWREDGYHTSFPDDIPERLLNETRFTVDVDGTMYGCYADHVHWADLPFDLSVAIVDDSLGDDAPARIELTATNRAGRAAELAMPGLAPFGVLRAYGPGGERLLWSSAYEASEHLRREDGVLRPQRRDDVLVDADASVSAVYEFGHGDGMVEAGSYEVPGVIWARWPTEPNQSEHDWRDDRFPYTLTLDVEA
jgi:hypothetical protein